MNSCIDCKEMKVLRGLDNALLDGKSLSCVQGHIKSPWGTDDVFHTKLMSKKGVIYSKLHRDVFKKANDCPDWDSHKPDKIDEGVRQMLKEITFGDDNSWETIVNYYMNTYKGE